MKMPLKLNIIRKMGFELKLNSNRKMGLSLSSTVSEKWGLSLSSTVIEKWFLSLSSTVIEKNSLSSNPKFGCTFSHVTFHSFLCVKSKSYLPTCQQKNPLILENSSF